MESGALGNPEATVAASTAPAAPPRDSIAVPAPSTASPLLSASEAQWDALAQRSENIFATQEWLSTWWRHFGASHESLVALERGIDGLPIAALPLYRSSRGPLRVLRFIGGGPSDQLGPVCAPADEVRAASSLRRYASSVPDWDLLLAEYLPGRRNWAHLLGGTETRRESSPTMSLTGLTWDGYLASRSSNFRQQVRRRERNLARGHDLSFRLADDPDRLHADLDTLFACTARAGTATARERSTARGRRFTASSRRSPSNVAGCGCGSSSSTAGRRRRGTASASPGSSPSTRAGATRRSSASRSGSCCSHTRSARR